MVLTMDTNNDYKEKRKETASLKIRRPTLINTCVGVREQLLKQNTSTP